ncbi:hypothetical protein OHB41_26045 [Streptomyces sp. NBC_01571]|uniref:hypothetical protein n=1 Tax=Streptomyces sp. NBC_01571 TaxID=2975883 RepID=UPI002257761A|nr:hypothetical protein [Streptomyces sp. NBC_01571]MCX4576573.1 hypothetical protein [Streptomyces sp. NBC_01571]
MSDEIFHSPDITGLPPKSLMPKSVHKLYDAREAAYGRWADFEADHAELTASNWEAAYAAKDEAAGREAVANGADPLSVPSALAQARDERPRVVGALRALVAEVVKADNALKQAVRLELGTIGSAIQQRVSEAADAYIAAQQVADSARGEYGAALLLRSWHANWAKLTLYTDYQEHADAEPMTASEGPAVDPYGKPLRGAAEVNAIDSSYGRLPTFKAVTIRSATNGQVLELTGRHAESHAAAHVKAGHAEYVDPGAEKQ